MKKILIRLVVLVLLGAAAWQMTFSVDLADKLEGFTSGSIAWEDAVAPGDLTEKHQFLGGDCRACHTAVTGVERTKCVSCHVAEVALLERQPTAFHAEVAECSGCHVEHEGSTAISNMDHDYLRLIAGQDTGERSPLATLKREVLAISSDIGTHGEPTETLVCSTCHKNEDVHFEFFGEDCASCHSEATWDIAGFRHPSPNSTECSQCHKAPPSHFMGHFKMVSQRIAKKPHSPVEACQDCHETNAWNDIANIGFYKHH